MSDEECEALLDVLAADWQVLLVCPPEEWMFDAATALLTQLTLGSVRAFWGRPVPAV